MNSNDVLKRHAEVLATLTDEQRRAWERDVKARELVYGSRTRLGTPTITLDSALRLVAYQEAKTVR